MRKTADEILIEIKAHRDVYAKDYAKLYKIAKAHMLEPVKLLEHLAHLMIQDINKEYPDLKSVIVKIKKHNPALGGVVNFSVVTVTYPEDYA